MDKLKKIPKWIYILLIFIIIIVINIIFYDSNSAIKNDSDDPNKYIYESNNNYNQEFEYDDISIAEEAEYDKYIQKEAEEKIINQKVFVRIKKIDENAISDESTSTTKKFTTIAYDQNNNQWQIIAKYQNAFPDEKNIKIYGIYRGISKENIPIVELYDYVTDINYINKEKIKKISDQYIQTLEGKYSKEKFKFNKYIESVMGLELEYINVNKDVELSINVDKEKNEIYSVSTYISNTNISFDDVDSDFWYAIITSFATDLSIEDAKNMIIGGRAAEIYSKSHSDVLNQYEYKNYKITVFESLKSIYIYK